MVLDIFFCCDFSFYCQISQDETQENILRTAFTYLCFLFQNMWKGRALIIFIVTFSIVYNFVKFFELTVQTKVSQSCTIFSRSFISIVWHILYTADISHTTWGWHGICCIKFWKSKHQPNCHKGEQRKKAASVWESILSVGSTTLYLNKSLKTLFIQYSLFHTHALVSSWTL